MEDRPYESCGEQVTVSGWACDKCNRFFGNLPDAEHLARWCCCTTRPCEADGCNGRAERHYVRCPKCILLREAERYAALPRVEWDGKTPLVDGDHYMWDADDVATHIDDVGAENVRLEICEPNNGPCFAMADFLHDDLPTDDEGCLDDTREIDAIVNTWIDEHAPYSWTGSGKVPTAESVLRHTGINMGEAANG